MSDSPSSPHRYGRKLYRHSREGDMKVYEYLASMSKTAVLVMAYLLVLLAGLLDFLTGSELSPTALYIIPVSIITWVAGKRNGIVSSLFCDAVLLTVELLGRHTYSHSFIPYGNLILRLCIMLVIVLLISKVKRQHEVLAAEVAEKTASLQKSLEEHVRAEDKIEQQKTFMEKIIESLSYPFYVIDASDYTVLLANSASGRLAGKQTCYALTHGLEKTCSQSGSACPLERVKETKKSVTVEHTHHDRDGNPRCFEVHALPVFDAAGNVAQLVEFSLDITERKQAEAKIEILNTSLAARAADLENANRDLKTFNYTVTHDLRKPLTIINGYSQAILELCADGLDAQCKGYLRQIYDGTLRMNQLIDTLLEFSRLTHVELHPQAVDLSVMAKEVAGGLMMSDPERRVTFRIAGGIEVNGDARLLRVVLENFFGNAWKYTGTREESIIEFGVMETEAQQVCFVRDNGIGFDMEHAEKLFLPFQRLPGASGFQGHGIGLASVQRIIELHGGKVWAEGEAGTGATFYFTLGARP
jgi:PAS domain S-box-containing protein